MGMGRRGGAAAAGTVGRAELERRRTPPVGDYSAAFPNSTNAPSRGDRRSVKTRSGRGIVAPLVRLLGLLQAASVTLSIGARVAGSAITGAACVSGKIAGGAGN